MNTKDPILGFTGAYRWLSNFAQCMILYDCVYYPSVENAYMAAKTIDVSERLYLQTCSAAEAKRYGRSVTLRSHWEELKVPLMRQFLIQKFDQEPYRQKLIETAGQYIEETNTWNDRFWGVCNGKGKNVLGLLIMDIRDDIISDVN